MSTTKFPRLVVLTGAGISAESGLRTFRGNDGMWEHENIEDVCTPEGYYRDKKRVKDFYNFLRKGIINALSHLARRVLEFGTVINHCMRSIFCDSYGNYHRGLYRSHN